MEEHDEGAIAAAALFTATDNMFCFVLAALKMALKQERMGGFTSDGRQIEPPIAHTIRPALEQFIAAHQTVGPTGLLPDQEATANRQYMERIQELRQQVLDAIREFET